MVKKLVEQAQARGAISAAELRKQRDFETHADQILRHGDKVIAEVEDQRRQRSGESGREVQIFYSYAHEDEALRDELNKHLKLLERQGILRGWHDREIRGGDEWDEEIVRRLRSADVILLLISADFMASDYIWGKELKLAMERHEAGEARVIPVILRPVDWTGAVFGKLQALPRDARPVVSWPSRDEAFLDVARGIRRVAEEMMGRK